jgi:uncharacterized membrane protein
MESSVQFEKKRLIAVLSVLTFGLTALFAVLGLGSLVPTTFVLGFFLVVPLVALLGDSLPFVADESDDAHVGEADVLGDDPIEELRSRYARGELTDEEFERRLERLIETEDAEVAGSGRSRERVFERE